MPTHTPSHNHPAMPGSPGSRSAPFESTPVHEYQPSPDPIDGARPSTTSEALHLAQFLSGDRLVLTVAEAAKLLGISRAFAYELVSRGELPVIRLGRRIVVPKVALLELVGVSTAAG
jgi:excisionase family DNA binding protein